MTGEASPAWADGRGAATTCGRDGVGAADDGIAGDRKGAWAGDAATPTGVGSCATAFDNSFVPHIPQKRFSSEFSLPHRGQRTPASSCLL